MDLVSTYFDYLDHMYAYLSTPLANSEDPQIDALGGDSLCLQASGSGRIESRELISPPHLRFTSDNQRCTAWDTNGIGVDDQRRDDLGCECTWNPNIKSLFHFHFNRATREPVLVCRVGGSRAGYLEVYQKPRACWLWRYVPRADMLDGLAPPNWSLSVARRLGGRSGFRMPGLPKIRVIPPLPDGIRG